MGIASYGNRFRIRSIAFIMICLFVAYDIAWANPEVYAGAIDRTTLQPPLHTQ